MPGRGGFGSSSINNVQVRETEKPPVILVSKDLNMQLKARAVGIECEDYLHDKVAPREVSNFEIPRIEASVELDGKLDEPVWRQAAVLDGFHQYQPVDGRPAEERTEVRVWYAPNAIYFGIRAWDKDPGNLRAADQALGGRFS